MVNRSMYILVKHMFLKYYLLLSIFIFPTFSASSLPFLIWSFPVTGYSSSRFIWVIFSGFNSMCDIATSVLKIVVNIYRDYYIIIFLFMPRQHWESGSYRFAPISYQTPKYKKNTPDFSVFWKCMINCW